MTTLGIGSRVWIAWTPDHNCSGDGLAARCHTGTVTAEDNLLSALHRAENGVRWWWVAADGIGDVSVREDLLHPIDDGETEADRARGMAVET